MLGNSMVSTRLQVWPRVRKVMNWKDIHPMAIQRNTAHNCDNWHKGKQQDPRRTYDQETSVQGVTGLIHKGSRVSTHKAAWKHRGGVVNSGGAGHLTVKEAPVRHLGRVNTDT